MGLGRHSGLGAYLLVEKCEPVLEEAFVFETGFLIESQEANSQRAPGQPPQCLITEGNGGIGNFNCAARSAAEWVLVSS
jgi:hypothetical protein